MWECASRQAAAEAEVRRLEAEAPAVEMACKWLRSVERRMVEAACNALQEHATEVLQFMCDDRDIGLELVPCGDHVELKVTHRGLEPARPDHLVLGVLALDVAAAEMRADEIRPLAVLAGGEDPPELKAAELYSHDASGDADAATRGRERRSCGHGRDRNQRQVTSGVFRRQAAIPCVAAVLCTGSGIPGATWGLTGKGWHDMLHMVFRRGGKPHVRLR